MESAAIADGTMLAADDEPTVGAEVLVGALSVVEGAGGFGWSEAVAAAVTELMEVIEVSPLAEPSHHASGAAWILQAVHPRAGSGRKLLFGHDATLTLDSYRLLT